LFEEQNSFITSLGEKFSQGIEGGQPFNAKDLLTEMILSPWFTAAGVDENTTPTPATIGNIGTRRLLTPEELEAKTASLTGWKWGADGYEDLYLYDSDYTSLTDKFGRYYGGIDSNGIRERARAMSSLMVNVAERQALEVACQAVVMDFAKTNSNRFLFSDIEPEITPDLDFGFSHSIASESFGKKETFSNTLELSSGEKILAIGFANDYYQSSEDDRDLYITNIEVTDPNGNLILDADFSEYNNNNLFESIPLQELNCGDYWFSDDSFRFWGTGCTIDLPFSASIAGSYEVKVSAWGVRAKTDQGLPKMSVSIKSEAPPGQGIGAMKIKSKIAKLYSQLHGLELNVNHPDVISSFDFLLGSWEHRKTIGNQSTNPWPLESCLWSNYDLANELNSRNDKDPSGMKYAWMSILIMLMTDFNYLHE
jgi:hypothetical protein